MGVQSTDYIRTFAKKLELMKLNNIDFLFYEMLPLCGIGTAVAYSRFLALHKKICFGSYSLIEAYKKDHTGLWGESIENSLWQRSMHFENAILAYNSIIDYVYAILYFNFDLYIIIGNTSIVDRDDIIRISRSIQRDILCKINEWLADQTTTKEFSNDFKYYFNQTKALSDLANDIKHRGHVVIEDMNLPRVTKVTKVINGNEINITELVCPKVINIDKEINSLVDIHQLSMQIQKKLYKLCDFPGKLNSILNNTLNAG